MCINPLNAKLYHICHLLVLLGAHHILHVSRIRVKLVTWNNFILWCTIRRTSYWFISKVLARINKLICKLHDYTVHQQYWTLFYYQLTHTTLKNVELLKHSKISKNAPTCFGLQGNHLQWAKISTWLKVTYLLLTKRVTFSQVLILAPWRWFPCKPKHVGAFLLILECFNNSTFFYVVCVSW